MITWLKRKLRSWLFSEYDKVCAFMAEVNQAKEEVVKVGGKGTFKEPVVFIGSLLECKVDIKPTLKPEIVLARLELEAALKIMGNNHIVTQSLFTTSPTAVKVKD